MPSKHVKKILRRQRVKRHVRKVVKGSVERPRATVFKSLKHIYIQAVDDLNGQTLCTASSLDKDLRTQTPEGGKSGLSKMVGLRFAEKLKEKGINNIVFDRNGYIYHGRISTLADAIREGGIQF